MYNYAGVCKYFYKHFCWVIKKKSTAEEEYFVHSVNYLLQSMGTPLKFSPQYLNMQIFKYCI